ncbi:CO dehydrogenase accessory protein CooC [Desulfocucumis palustris]|uniref:CO dehydrogenase accessory protein CooC n=1 Tax=Desulfocucumis palustris TaxID=1898651 RepID=A0A2L2XDM9_9FIRM|nr:ArsA-related P-loop ATPase [Desulfocucumis palustris]GBF31931.1 CO dehydrogenase accessory protein CooC [Desulfocucumis palustris]
MKLAISGKGGVGKTTIAAALVKSFAETHQTVYAIDADPDACLAAAVGIPGDEAANIKPVVEMRDKIRAVSGGGAFYVLNPKLDDSIDDYCHARGNIRFMRMGDVKKGGSECYCRENTFLSALLSSLLLDKDEVVVMDMGAGIEHLSRGTARGVDLMLVVVEPSRNSINTARNVMSMAQDLGINNIKIIANKIRSDKEKEFIEKSFQPGEVLGFLAFNNTIWESGMEPDSNAAGGELLVGMREVREKILREVGGQ